MKLNLVASIFTIPIHCQHNKNWIKWVNSEGIPWYTNQIALMKGQQLEHQDGETRGNSDQAVASMDTDSGPDTEMLNNGNNIR